MESYQGKRLGLYVSSTFICRLTPEKRPDPVDDTRLLNSQNGKNKNLGKTNAKQRTRAKRISRTSKMTSFSTSKRPLIDPSDKDTSWFSTWLTESVWPGMGLFGESYLLFSVGTLKPIWEALYPHCFSEITCPQWLIHSLSYGVVVGVILGMITLGIVSNVIGRRKGSLLTASLMSIGSLSLVGVSFFLASNEKLMLSSMSCSLFLFGIGVGGEYPLSASSASERAMAEMKLKKQKEQEKGNSQACLHDEDALNSQLKAGDSRDSHVMNESFGRGKRVQLMFAMQGMGIFVNTIVLTFLLLLVGRNDETKNDDQNLLDGRYTDESLLVVWRLNYVAGAIILFAVLVGRCLYLSESKVWSDDKESRLKVVDDVIVTETTSQALDTFQDEKRTEEASRDSFSTTIQMLRRHYIGRLFGSSACWLLWDVAFYGNKLFQSSFLLALTGENTTLLEISAASMLNAFVALLGYFGASLLLDLSSTGRKRLQTWGFLVTGCMFCSCGFLYERLNVPWLVLLYLASSFFGQLGPNATTFVIPTEIFPTQTRTMCHGVAAAFGKVGALIAAVWFPFVAAETALQLSGVCSLVGAFFTFLLIPETTSLDLYELDRQWWLTLVGKRSKYEGPANEHISLWEASFGF